MKIGRIKHFYPENGTGRDLYIGSNNGGMYKNTSFMDHGYFSIGTMRKNKQKEKQLPII